MRNNSWKINFVFLKISKNDEIIKNKDDIIIRLEIML